MFKRIEMLILKQVHCLYSLKDRKYAFTVNLLLIYWNLLEFIFISKHGFLGKFREIISQFLLTFDDLETFYFQFQALPFI